MCLGIPKVGKGLQHIEGVMGTSLTVSVGKGQGISSDGDSDHILSGNEAGGQTSSLEPRARELSHVLSEP